MVSAEIRRHHLGQSVLRRIRISEFLARIISQIVYVAPVRERERERKRRECVHLCNTFCSNSNVAFIIAKYLSTCLDHKNTISRFKKNRNDTRFLLPVVLLLLRFITIKDSVKMTVSAKDDEPNEALQTLEKSLTPTPSSQGKKKQKRESSSVPGKVPLVKDDDDGGAGGGADGAKKKNKNEGGENTEVQFKRDFFEKQWRKDARIYEYGSAANPDMKPIPVLVHPPDWHERGETRIIPFDIDDFLEIDKQCTSPNSDGVVYSHLRRGEFGDDGERDESSVLRHSRERVHDERTRDDKLGHGRFVRRAGVRAGDVARMREGGERWCGVILGTRRTADGLFGGHAE